jgi:hypothetical protein
MNMNLSELINEIVTDWAYRVNDGIPNPKNPAHLKELSIVLSEMGLSHIKDALIENLLTEKGKTPQEIEEADKNFTNPVLNKKVTYKSDKGEDKEGIVGNLLRQPEGSPARTAAEKMLPPEGSPEREKLNQELGGEGQPKKPEDGDGEKAGGADAEKEKQKKAAAMFDPKADPAMGARMDREKAANDKLAQQDKEDTATEKPKDEPNPLDAKFEPIDIKDVAKEMPQADTDTFSGGSDIPDAIDPKELEQFNTDINKVAQQVADAKAKGEPAPNVNLCDVTVPGTNLYCDDNLGIPRDEMPQFKGTAQPGSKAAGMDADASGEVDTEPVFREMLKQKGIKTLQTEVPADKLKATQKDLVGAKVVGMMGALEKDPNHPKITAPIYVSRDGYVIDGHHRWAAIVAYNAQNPDKQIPMKTTVLDQDIKDAIPMANKFAEDMGIAAKKADANKETPSTPTSVGKSGLTDKVKKKIENWTKEEKAFFERNEGAPGSEMRRSLGQALKDKAAGAWKAIKKGAKHEVEEFKAAGSGVKNFFSGKELSEHEIKAVKAVGFKIVTTAIFGAAMGGLGHGVAAFGKHVAMEFIPHVIGETILKGAGRAALFADMEGEAEMDANMEKFAELIAKGLEEMEITPEMMEQMVDSYNKKKESGEADNVETPIEPKMKEESIDLANELMLEMIYGFIDEAFRKEGESSKYPGYFRIGGNYYSKQPGGEITHISDSGAVRKLKAAEKKAADAKYGNNKPTAPTTSKKQPKVAGSGMTYRNTPDISKTNTKKVTTPAAKKEEPQTTNPYAQPGQKVTNPKEVAKLMASDTKKVLNALNKTKEQEQAEKEAAKKAGKKLGVGAGTAASRAGECAVVSGGKMLTKAIADGIPFDEAIKKVEANLRKVANNADTLLDNEWVTSAITTLTYINDSIGFQNIEQFTWDTDEGRAVVGSEGHGTSSDCFMLLKNGGRLGLSLKKDLNVFVFSGGMGDMMKDLESQGMSGLPTLEDYKNRRTQEINKIDTFAKDASTRNTFCKDFNSLKANPESRFEAKGLSNRLASIQKVSGKPLQSLSCNEFINSVVSKPKGDNIKILADMCKTSNTPQLKEIYKNTRGLDREMTDKVTTNFIDPKNKAVVNELVRKETHIDDILFPNNAHLDKLMVVYGEDPAIEMKKENLIGLLGIGADYAAYHKEKNPSTKAKLKAALDEKINSQIKVTNKGGVMSVGIDIGKSIIPIFEARVRTRGIGNAPTFEMPQSRFGGLAFKNGTTNFREWKDPKDRIDVVSSMSKELIDDMEDLDVTDKQTKEEIIGRIKRLRAILPEGAKNKNLNKALLKLRDLGLDVN